MTDEDIPDPLRTPEWELRGFWFLQNSNPKRYFVTFDSFLDGMFVHRTLIDKRTGEQIGNELIESATRGVVHYGEKKEDRKRKSGQVVFRPCAC